MAGRIKHLFSGQVTTVVNVDAVNSHDIANIVLSNTTAALAYLQLFCLPAASVTLGTTVPNYVIPLLASGGVSIPFEHEGWHTGGPLCIAATTTRGGLTTAAVDVVIWEFN